MGRTKATARPIWRPDRARADASRISDYMKWLKGRGQAFESYDALWRWSTSDLSSFWASIWDYFGVRGTRGDTVLAASEMPGADWFPDARLNFVDRIFEGRDPEAIAIVASNEAEEWRTVSFGQLRAQVASLAATFRALGVGPGDRVAAYLPNVPEAAVAFLACASIGAIWSQSAIETGPAAVLDRFQQIEPKLLIASESYQWNGKVRCRREAIGDLIAGLPSVEQLILVPGPDVLASGPRPGASVMRWHEALAPEAELETTPVAFAHPLWIVYSSGTTGLPKAIVHGHGGITLEAMKYLGLHYDIGPGDRYHWYASSGWIMWNLQVAGLLLGATICIYDGSPAWPDLSRLWRFAEAAKVTVFGAGAAFYASCEKAGLVPRLIADLGAIRTIGSTGSPLPPESYAWIYEAIGADVFLAPGSGGTDIASGFVGPHPTLPIVPGEMQVRCLGMKVASYDPDGEALIGEVGELVCTAPAPSMPLFFWGDAGDVRYLDSYFDTYAGIWRHGDWIEITSRGGAIVHGRSDATINRHGVRMGTSEFYRVLDTLPEIADSLVVDCDYYRRPSSITLFVVLRPGVSMSPQLERRIGDAIRALVSPRHVPDLIVAAPDIPRTISGKKMEVPVKKLMLGFAPAACFNRDTMANPDCMDFYVETAKARIDR
jgi:acetoacetyl-CoA synthetase